jgi:hypothetical protein
MTLREAAQQALEALEDHAKQYPHMQKGYTVDAINALRTALAEPEQEPVAWLFRDSWGTLKLSQIMPPPVGAFPVYTHPVYDTALLRQALTTLEGWANHGDWVWPESALEQAKRNTEETINALRERLYQDEAAQA